MAEGVTEKQQCVGHGKKATGRERRATLQARSEKMPVFGKRTSGQTECIRGGREALGQNTKSSAGVNLKERQGSRRGERVAGEGNGGGDAGEREKPCHVALCRSRVVLRILC